MSSFSEIYQKLRSAKRILVVSHARPDGDALGSTLAAALWLRQEGHSVTAWNEDGVPQKFSYLPDANLITKPSEQVQEFDAILVLDTANKERLGKKVLASARSPLWLAIDHHVSNDFFAHQNFVLPSSSATGEILAEGFLQEKIAMTPAIASNLYAAISTDTGSFQYSSTTTRTFEIAALLVKAGVCVGEFSQSMYGSQPRRRLELLRHALTNAKFSCGDRIASFSLRREDVAALGTLPEDTEGIIDCLRSVEGVEAAVFFEELMDNQVRMSLRSKNISAQSADSASNAAAPLLAPSIPYSSSLSATLKTSSKRLSFDASAFCQQYGGGGHSMAAGATSQGSIEEVEKKVLTQLCEWLSK